MFSAVTGSDGAFSIPAMPPGTYTATVTLQGFKTADLKNIVLNVGVTASVKATLEPGGLEETVTVGAATEVVQTQQTSVATTLTTKQISNIPIQGRGAFDLVTLFPGVASSTGSSRDANIIGLPQATVNITLDGMNIQDNYARAGTACSRASAPASTRSRRSPCPPRRRVPIPRARAPRR